MVNAVVLAGNPKGEEDKQVYGRNKALIEISNKPLVGYIIDVVKNSNINKIAVVGPKKSLEEKIDVSDNIEFVEESDDESKIKSFFDNLIRGYRKTANPEGVIYLACDIPLITKEIINKETKRFQNTDADLILMLTDQQIIPEYFLQLKKNSPLRLDGKGYRWSNMFFVKNIDADKFLLDLVDTVGPALSFRRLESLDTKKKLSAFVFKKFGKIALKYRVGWLKKEDVKQEVYKKFHQKLEIIEASSYESSVDIDYGKDFEIVKDYILNKNS